MHALYLLKKSAKLNESKTNMAVSNSDPTQISVPAIFLAKRRQTRRQGITFAFDLSSFTSKGFEE